MADEGQIPVEPTGTAEPTPANEPGQPQQSTAPTLFGGKTAEQFAEEFSNAQRELASLKESYSQAMHEAQYSRTLLEKMAVGNAPQVQTNEPTLAPIPDDQFYANPGRAAFETAQKVAEASLGKWKSEFEAQRKRERDEQAGYNMNMTSQNVMKANPKMYSGIENEVKAALTDAYQSGRIGVFELGNPQFWDNTAAMIRVMKGERDLAKYMSNSVNPASPGGIEAPTAGMPPSNTVTLTAEEKATVRWAGITEEQYLEQKKKDKAEHDKMFGGM